MNDPKSRIERIDNHIRMEYDLMGQRMSWMVISQSFLFSAVALTANSSVDRSMRQVIELLRLLIPFIGVLSCLLSSAAIIAARSVIGRLKHLRDYLEDTFSGEYAIDKLGVRQTEWQHSLGNFPTSFLPFTLVCVWFIILVSIIFK